MKNATGIRLYVSTCCLAAVGIAAIAVSQSSHFSWTSAAGFSVLAFTAAQFPLQLSGGSLYDISFVIGIAALLAGGPIEAVLAMSCTTLVLRESFHRSPIRNLFNLAQLVISTGTGALIYLAIGGRTGTGITATSALGQRVLLPLLAATAVMFTANSTLVSLAISISDRKRLVETWQRTFGSLAVNFIAFALLGLLLGLLRVLLGWSSVFFVLMPLLVARQAFQAAATMQGAYDETVKGLVAAIEAKDPYTRGHAQRVSQLSEMTARAYGLSEERCRAIRYSALMHDVGKLGVWNKVLKKPGKLTPEEYEHMKDHPVLGVEIVSEIDLLQEAIDGVRHHHERMDGQGYPDGLKGEDIPLFARLIMVCDAFDSMTSTRVYRVAKTIEEAFAELRRCAGTQFDVASLNALEKAVAQHGWQPVGREDMDEEPVEIQPPAEMEKGPSDGSQAASV